MTPAEIPQQSVEAMKLFEARELVQSGDLGFGEARTLHALEMVATAQKVDNEWLRIFHTRLPKGDLEYLLLSDLRRELRRLKRIWPGKV